MFIVAQVARTGIDETTFMGVYLQLQSLTALCGVMTPNSGKAIEICSKLGASRLLICEHSRNDLYQKILLNISSDDIYYATQITAH